MSGHSKWASIKHKKAATDAKRGKAFTKLIREIMMAAKTGGGNVENNPRLAVAIDRAKAINMPNDNITRAIKKGTGEDGALILEHTSYEGYGPGGVAVLMDILTDNKRRTAAEIRSFFSRHNGNLGESGCVAYLFDRKGQIILKKSVTDEETLMGIVLDAGADDLQTEEDEYEVLCAPESLETVKKALEENALQIESAMVTLIPKNYVRVEGKEAEQLLKLLDELEEHDDVQNVYANFDIPEEIMQSLDA